MAKPKIRHVKFTPEEMAYDLPKEIEALRLIPIIGRGMYADEMRGESPLKATYVVVDDALVTFTLNDGRRISSPIEWYPRLKHATPAERNDWRLVLGGRAVLWETLRIGISVKAIVEGVRASESSASLRKWLSDRRAAERKKAG